MSIGLMDLDEKSQECDIKFWACSNWREKKREKKRKGENIRNWVWVNRSEITL